MKIGIVGDGGLPGLALGASTLNSLLRDTEIHVLVRSEEAKNSISGIVNKVALAWGLMDLRIIPIRSFSSNLSFQNYTHLILCHPNMYQEINSIGLDCTILANWESNYNMNYHLRNLENVTLDEAQSEVAKVIGSFVKAANMSLDSTIYKKKSVFIPIRQDDCDLAYASAQFDASINLGIVLNSDFRAKKSFNTKNYSEIIEYNPKNIDMQNISQIPKGALLTPSQELSHPEKFLLDKCWLDFVRKLSVFHPISMVTAPRIVDGRKLPDSYLVSGMAGEVFKIGV